MKSISQHLQSSELSLAEIEKMKSLDRDFFPVPWSDSAWAEWLGKEGLTDDWSLWTGKLQQAIDLMQGFALYQLNSWQKQVHLIKIVVNDESRGHGLGEDLLRTSLAFFKDRGFETAFLEVSTTNTRALHLYHKIGFQEVNKIKGFYSNGDDALCMLLSFETT